MKFQPREQILTFEEIERFVRVAVTLGVRKLRITGGEPLVRKDLATLIRKLAAIEGIEDLALTTNGVLLGAIRPRSFTTPDCGVSMSIWIRWIASASRRSRGATISKRCSTGSRSAGASATARSRSTPSP